MGRGTRAPNWNHTWVNPERKVGSVLFADIVGSSTLIAGKDPEEANDALLGTIQVMIDAVQRFGGVVNQVLGDGIMALFGAPVAQEHHAIRACLAAQAMQSAIRNGHTASGPQRSPAIRVGIDSGEVVAHQVDKPIYPEYRATGECVHTAARMQELASPGSAFMTDTTLKLISCYVDARPVGSFRLAEASDPIQVYELKSVDPTDGALAQWSLSSTSAFVGRRRELRFLHDHWDAVRTGTGKALILSGDPGIGKSRLIAEFLSRLPGGGYQTARCALLPAGLATLSHPFTRIAESLLRLGRRQGQTPLVEAMAAFCESDGLHGHDALNPDLGMLETPPRNLSRTELDGSQPLDPNIETIIEAILATGRVQPLILVIEDIHWADSLMLLLIERLAHRLPLACVLMIVTCRNDHKRHWTTWPNCIERALGPLSPKHRRRLHQLLLGNDPSIETLKEDLERRAAGNPFFLQECICALVDAKALAGRPGRYWLVRPVGETEAPATIRATLAARADVLPPNEREILLSASIVGQRIDISLLQDLVRLPRSEVVARANRLCDAGFLECTRVVPNLEYSFRHALTQEVAYAVMLKRHRRERHGMLLRAIEARPLRQLPGKVEALAYHACRAENWPRAYAYCRKAGEKAQAKSRHKEAVNYFEDARMALDQLPRTWRNTARATDLNISFVQSLFPLGQFDSVERQLREAEAMAVQISDRHRRARIASQMTLYHWVTGSAPQAAETARTAVRLAGALGDVLSDVSGRVRLGSILVDRGEYREAAHVLSLAMLRAAQGAENGRLGLLATTQVAASASLARCWGEIGLFRDATVVGDDAIRDSEEFGHAFSRSYAYLYVTNALMRKGDFERSLPLLEQALVLCQRNRFNLLLPLALGSVGYAHARTGNLSEGVRLLTLAVEKAEQQRLLSRLPLELVWLAEAYLLKNRPDTALSSALKALSLAQRNGEQGNEAWAQWVLGEIHLHEPASCTSEPEEHFAAAQRMSTTLGMAPLGAHCHMGLARLHERRGARQRAQQELHAAVSQYRKLGMEAWLRHIPEHLRQFVHMEQPQSDRGALFATGRRETII